MEKQQVLVFLSEHYADWEIGYVCAVLNKSESPFMIKTVGLTRTPLISMAGLTVIPDYALNEIPSQFAMLILPGGTTWLNKDFNVLKNTIDWCLSKSITVAAICDACTFLARHGYLDLIFHTGNTLPYLKQFAPDYQGEQLFLEKQAVYDQGIITANGSATMEFSCEILRNLNVMPEDALTEWYLLFKNGYYK